MFRGRSKGGMLTRSWPSRMIRPEVGVSKPANMRSKVVLPQPEEPSRAKISPLAIERLTRSTARCVPKFLLSSMS